MTSRTIAAISASTAFIPVVRLEQQIAEDWIYSQLAANADVAAIVGDRIFSYQAEEGTQYPYLVFSMHTNSPSYVIPRRLWYRFTYWVRIVSRDVNSFEPTDQGVIGIRTALDQKVHQPVAEGPDIVGMILSSLETQIIRYPETDNGVEYRYNGGFYELEAQAA